MNLFYISIVLATLLCSLVAGFLFAFSIVIMPGLKSLADQEFLQSFRVMDRVIQDGHPIFILVWVGSAVALVMSAILGYWQVDGAEYLIVVLATLIYFLGVQLPTASINIPLNNRVQKMELDSTVEDEIHSFRQHFESQWNRWNSVRTVFAVVVAVLLIALLVRL